MRIPHPSLCCTRDLLMERQTAPRVAAEGGTSGRGRVARDLCGIAAATDIWTSARDRLGA